MNAYNDHSKKMRSLMDTSGNDYLLQLLRLLCIICGANTTTLIIRNTFLNLLNLNPHIVGIMSVDV